MAQEVYSLDEIDINDLISKSEIKECFSSVPLFDPNTSFNLSVNGNEIEQNSINKSMLIQNTENFKKNRVNQNDKPPEPYVDIIGKAILSANDNILQLKDIYNYVIENYQEFTSKVETSKWKSAIRHNLSSQKYFTKTSKKNAQGHYWTIEAVYLKALKDSINSDSIKKSAKLLDKKTKVKKPKKKSSNDNNQVCSSPYLTDSSSKSDSNCSSIDSQNYYNDSAYFSSYENEYSPAMSPSYKFLNQNISTYQTQYLPDDHATLENNFYISYSNQFN